MPERKRIMVVDDDPNNRELLETFLEAWEYDVETACDGIEALHKVDESIDLILLDAMMPGKNGFEVLEELRAHKDFAQLPVIVVTALSSREDRLRAVKVGASDFVTKPVDRTELQVRVQSLLKLKETQDKIKTYQTSLEERIQHRTSELRAVIDELVKTKRRVRNAHIDTIYRLTMAAEYKDQDTAAHILRMSGYAALLGKELGMEQDEVEVLRHACTLHDVGKIAIPDKILLKAGKLDADEWTTMQEHTTIGARILRNSPSRFVQSGEIIALTHHEKWDGSGYPNGIAGENIPLWGRICAVADVFDALTSERPYKKAFTNDKALSIMQEGRGRHFDPRLIDVFVEHFEQFVSIQQQYQELDDDDQLLNRHLEELLRGP